MMSENDIIKYEICANLNHPAFVKLRKPLQDIVDISKKYPELIRYISSQECKTVIS